MTISDESRLLEGGAEAGHDQLAVLSDPLQPMERRRTYPNQVIRCLPEKRSVGNSPPMMQSLQQSD